MKINPFEKEAEQFINHFYMRTVAAKMIYLGSIERILRLANLQPGEKVADLGCGSGILLKNVLKTTPHAIGVDSSQEMLDLAVEHLPKENLYLGNVLDLKFLPDESFDVILNRALFQHLESTDHPIFLKESCRLLKKGGRLISFMPIDSPLWRLARTFSAVFVRERKNISGVMYPLSHILGSFRKAGFPIEKIEFYGWFFYPFSGYGTGIGVPVNNRWFWKRLIEIDNLICRTPLLNKFGAINVLVEAVKE